MGAIVQSIVNTFQASSLESNIRGFVVGLNSELVKHVILLNKFITGGPNSSLKISGGNSYYLIPSHLPPISVSDYYSRVILVIKL